MTLEEKFHFFSKPNLPCPDHRGISIILNENSLKQFAITDKIILNIYFDISNPQKKPMNNLFFLEISNGIEYYSLNLINPHLHDFSKNECIFNLKNGSLFQFTFTKFPETIVYVFDTLVYYNQPPQNIP